MHHVSEHYGRVGRKVARTSQFRPSGAESRHRLTFVVRHRPASSKDKIEHVDYKEVGTLRRIISATTGP